MIQNELYKTRADGVKLFRTFSDSGMMILKAGTDLLYSEAVDVEDSGFTYTETDNRIEPSDAPVTLEDALSMLRQLGVNTDDNQE